MVAGLGFLTALSQGLSSYSDTLERKQQLALHRAQMQKDAIEFQFMQRKAQVEDAAARASDYAFSLQSQGDGQPPSPYSVAPPGGAPGVPQGGGMGMPSPPQGGGMGMPSPPQGGGMGMPFPPQGGGMGMPFPPQGGGMGMPSPPQGGGMGMPPAAPGLGGSPGIGGPPQQQNFRPLSVGQVAAAIKQKMPNLPPGALAEAVGNYAHLMAPEERSIVQQAMQAQKMQGAFDLMTERMRGAESMAQMREIAANTRAQLMANSRGQAINTPQGLYWASPEGARPLTTPDGNPITGATKLAAPATAKETNKTTKLAAPATAKETNKTKELASNVAAVTSAIDSLLNQLKSGSASAGISGAVNRAWEHVTGPLGMAQPQREFSNDMDRLKASASKLLTNMGYHSKAAQAQIDNLIKGDEIGSNAELAQHSLEALRDFLQQKYSETQPKGGGWSIEPVK